MVTDLWAYAREMNRLRELNRRPPPGYISVEEVMDKLNIGKRTVFTLAAHNSWPGILKCGRRYFAESSVNKTSQIRRAPSFKPEHITPMEQKSGQKQKLIGNRSSPLGQEKDVTDGHMWVSSKLAAEWLNVTRAHVHDIAKKANFETTHCRKPSDALGQPAINGRFTAWFRLRDVILEITRREKAQSTAFDPTVYNRYSTKPCIRTEIVAPEGDYLISIKDAAAILEIGPRCVAHYVESGRLFAWQKNPGRRGSRMYLSMNQVVRYSQNETRLRRRSLRLQGPDQEFITETERWWWLEEHDMAHASETGHGSKSNKNYGEYYSSQQAMRVLNIGWDALANLRKRGRITAYQRPKAKKDGAGNKWWFYKKDEVQVLLSLNTFR